MVCVGAEPTDPILRVRRGGTSLDCHLSNCDELNNPRFAISSSAQEHYPCTRAVAKAIQGSTQNLAGIVWHSRQTEISHQPDAEALILFADRLAKGRNALALTPSLTAVGAIGEGAGRIVLDELLEDLGVTVVSPLS